MIYTFLNILLLVFFVYFTFYIDKNVRSERNDVSSFSVSILYALIATVIFIFAQLFQKGWYDSFLTQVMRLVLAFEGFFLINVSFGLVKFGLQKKKRLLRLLTTIMVVILLYLVYFRIDNIILNPTDGFVIESDYIFTGAAREFFPWTWKSVYFIIFRFFLPFFCFISLLVIAEQRGTQLEKYQAIVMGEAFGLMWISHYCLQIISTFLPEFSLLYLYPLLFQVVMVSSALTKTVVPSGKGLLISVAKLLICYLIPAAGVGAVSMIFQPTGNADATKFTVMFVLAGGAIAFFALYISKILSSTTKIYTADYEVSLEKDLASINYQESEMDEITTRMTEIMRKNVETSSMNVFILNGQNELETAYSTNNMYQKIPAATTLFDNLLNINKGVTIWSEIEKSHEVSSIKNELDEFFTLTKSDALFVLNEGHNIFGIITLGRKTSGDHYKEYDYNVFVKLYSYFFVFGYYMRNIANKDVIGTVNREIRMSSQIITSIQENIDHLKTNKVDAGYLMVPSHNIGGEFIDMIRLTDNRHLFVVGDLSGKGIAASMNMVILKSIIRTYLSEIHDFKQLVVKINSFIRDSLRKGTIFSGLFALVDFETDTMYYINCGIPALMMYTQVYNNVIEIQGSGHVLGFVKDIAPFISVKTTKLNRGDILVACTDGMIQSHSLRGEQFGKERLQQAILDNSSYAAQRMAQFTFDGLMKFMSKEMEDDVSLLILKYETGLEFQNDEAAAQEAQGTDEADNADAAAQAKSELPEEGTIDIPENATAPDVEASSSEAAAVSENTLTEAAETTESAASAESAETSASVEPEKQTPPSDDPFPGVDGMPDLSDLDAMLKEAGL